MALNNPTPGLRPARRLRLDKAQPAKVAVTVQPGDEIEAGGVVAEQLEAAGMTEAATPKPKPAKKPAVKKAAAKK